MSKDPPPSLHLLILPAHKCIFPHASTQSAPSTQSFSLCISCGLGCFSCFFLWGPRPPLLGATMKAVLLDAFCFLSPLFSALRIGSWEQRLELSPPFAIALLALSLLGGQRPGSQPGGWEFSRGGAGNMHWPTCCFQAVLPSSLICHYLDHFKHD